MLGHERRIPSPTLGRVGARSYGGDCMSRGGQGRGGRSAVAAFAASAALTLAALTAMAPAAEIGSGGYYHVGSGSGFATINLALIEAYRNNPQLNSQRAATRAADEAVPTALSGY